MIEDLRAVRYRGDLQDVEELLTTYRVGDYLETAEEQARDRERGLRQQLLKDGIRLSEPLSPRIFRLFREVCETAGIDAPIEVFCLPDSRVNAFASLDIQEKGQFTLVAVTAGALELLSDAELKAILGHEVGHIAFAHNRLSNLISTDENNPSLTVLPPFGESLFLRWRKKAEISSDRIGLLAAGDFDVAARALLRATFGLSEKNLNLDVEALLAQIDEIRQRPELLDEAFASHPLLPIRLKALDLFARSKKARRNGFVAKLPETELLDDNPLEDAVDQLLLLTRRYPWNPLEKAKMRAIALAGALLLSADGDCSNDEIKILIHILHGFTDEPEKEIVTDRAEIERQLPDVMASLKQDGDESDCIFVLSRLADVALADGALMKEEGVTIPRMAAMMGVSQELAYKVMVGAAQAVGFRTDVKMNRMADQMRRSLATGMGAARTTRA